MNDKKIFGVKLINIFGYSLLDGSEHYLNLRRNFLLDDPILS